MFEPSRLNNTLTNKAYSERASRVPSSPTGMNRAQTQKLHASESTAARAHARVLGAVTIVSSLPNLKSSPSIDVSYLRPTTERGVTG